MKKKRYLPFGYEMIHGQYVLIQEEQHLIQDIFSQYLAGASLQQLAYAAERTGIKFRENTDKWNKNMISRILEDDRYWRGSPFPEIITQQTAWKAMELKAEKTAPKSEIAFLRKKLICCQCFKSLHRNGKNKPNIYWDCPKCGMRFGPFSDQEFLCAVTQKILTLCRKPEKIIPDPVLDQAIPMQVTCLTNEINQMLDQREVDPERALALIAESESISGNVTKGIRMGYRQGRFTFRYTNFLGYRKGADGQPEIVPEEAETIRLIAQSFLNGDSLYTIKQTLEHRGILTATGKTEWNTQAIQRILQNEKYMGDILLQKTYTADFIEGKVRKNRGELPQYYIRDNHPAIIPREMFFRIQEEINRRKSKKPASTKKSKTNRGKFTSKYAFSERLVCGECGSYFRRVTWNIHGRKQIVWRCVNRLENGPKPAKNQ